MNIVRWYQSKISVRIALSAVILVFVIVGSIGTVSYFMTRKFVLHSISESIKSEALLIEDRIETLLNRVTREMENLSANLLIINALVDTRGRDAYILPFFKNYKMWENIPIQITLCDFKGRPIASNVLNAQSYEHNTLVKHVIERTKKYAGIIDKKHEKRILLAYPVVYPATRTAEGMLVVEVTLSNVLSDVLNAREKNRELILLLQYHNKTIWKNTEGEIGDEHITFTRPLHLHAPLQDLGFEIVAGEKKDTAYVLLNRLRMSYVTIAFVVIAVTLLLSRSMANTIAAPIISLSNAARKIRDTGTASVRIPTTRRDELGYLAVSFNSMLDALQDYQQNLEQRVVERTREIQKLFVNLKTEVEERTEAEKKLAVSEKKYRDLIDNSLVGILQVSLDGKILFANATMLSMFEFSNFEELRAHGVLKLYRDPAERQNVTSILKEKMVLSGHEADFLTKTGKALRIALNSRLDGDVITSIILNISEKTAMMESLQYHAQIIQQSSYSIISTDLNGNILTWNKGAELLYGYNAGEAIGRHVSILYPESEKKFLQENIIGGLRMKDNLDIEVRLLKKTGDIFDAGLSLWVIRDAQGNPAGLVGYSLDITERKKMENLLNVLARKISEKTGEEYFRSVTEFIAKELKADYVFIGESNDDRTIRTIALYAGGQFVDNIEYVLDNAPHDTVVGKEPQFYPEHVRKLFPLDADLAKMRAESYAAIPLFTSDGKHLGLLAIIKRTSLRMEQRDRIFSLLRIFATRVASELERRVIEAQLRERKNQLETLSVNLAERVREEVTKNWEKDRMMILQSRQAAMGEMLGNIAHQWRQPLNIVGLVLQNIRDAYDHEELTKEFIDNNLQTGMSVLRLMSQTIDDFRNFFKPDKEKKQFDITSIIDKTLFFLDAAIKNNNIVVELEKEEQVTAEGYPNEYAQVILNILNNSKDVLVERKIRSPRIRIRAYSEGKRSVVAITDNGGGINPAFIDKIFDPYFTTKDEGKGTGIGLYMSKVIIEKNMNGILTARNIEGGAEFKIEV